MKIVKDRETWHAAVHGLQRVGHDWATEQQQYVVLLRNINNLRYADGTTLMAESEEELKSLLMKVKENSGKSWLKAQHSES